MNIYVKTDGNDVNNGTTWDLAVKHIHQAIDISFSNDIIIIRDGTYDEEVGRDLGNKNLTIKSESEDYSTVVIKPLTLVQTWHSGWKSWLYYDHAETLTLQDITIKFDSNFIANKDTYNAAIMSHSISQGNTYIIRCFILGENWSTRGDGINSAYNDKLYIYKCTIRGFSGSASSQYSRGVTIDLAAAIVKDCILESNYWGIYKGGTLDETYNNFYNNTKDIEGDSIDGTDLTSDPEFTGVTVADWVVGSPCKDAGITIPTYIEDYHGIAPDIGCFEGITVPGSNFDFEWNILQAGISSDFDFEWNILQAGISSDFDFEWNITQPNRFYHILTYPLIIETPAIKTYNFSVSVAGILDSVAIDFGNTGSSGSTIIKVYINTVLKKTITVVANNAAYNTVEILENDIVNYTDKIKIEITSVAVDSQTLSIAVNERTCPYQVDILSFWNQYNDVYFESDCLFNESDSWVILLNQPITSIVKVTAQRKGQDAFDIMTTTLSAHNFGNNRIDITPKYLGGIDSLLITVIDINNQVKIIPVPCYYEYYFDTCPKFATSTFDFSVNFNVSKCYYSWDNITYHNVTVVDNNVSITNMPASDGEYTFYLRYYLSDSGGKVVSINRTMQYYTADINVTISMATRLLTWADEVPPDKVEIYLDGILSQTLDIPIHISNLNISYNEDTYKLTVQSGTKVYYKRTMLTLDEKEFTLSDDLASEGDSFARVLCFNTVTNSLVLIAYDTTNAFDMTYTDLNIDNCIPLRYYLFSKLSIFDTSVPSLPVLTGYQLKKVIDTDVFVNLKLPFFTKAEVIYRIYDIVGRHKDITYASEITDARDYDYELTVTDAGSTEVLQGELHQNDTLTYTIEERA